MKLHGEFVGTLRNDVARMVVEIESHKHIQNSVFGVRIYSFTKRRMQKLENLHYYVLSTLFPLPVHLDDQHGEFLESWMAYLEFDEFPNLIKYYTTIVNGTLLKQKYTTIKECTLLQDIEHFISRTTHPTKSYT